MQTTPFSHGTRFADEAALCYLGSCSEVYLEKAFDSTGWRPTDGLPAASELGETSMMLVVHPTLNVAKIENTWSVIDKLLRAVKC